MNIYWDLYLTFFRIGGLTFGGGLTMLPLLQAELVDNKKWITEEELMDYYAIGQCTPGIIAVNVSTFVGYRLKGIWGGIITTLGIVSPSLILITIIASFLTRFSSNPYVQNAFGAIRVVVGVLVLNTAIKMWKTNMKDKLGIYIGIISFIVLTFTNISPIIMVISGGTIGLIVPMFIRGDIS